MTAKKDAPRQQLEVQEPHVHILAARQYLVVRHTHIWQPPTDVMESEDRLYVIVEIAGMQQGEFNVTLSPSRLTITGMRPAPARVRAAYHQMEVRHGEFRSDVALPWAVEEEEITARYVDGFLYIDLPRARTEKIHSVSVDKIEEG